MCFSEKQLTKMNIIWIVLTCICSLCTTTYCEKEDSIILPSSSPMVAIPFELAKQQITHALQKFDGQKHNIIKLEDYGTFYVYSRRIFIEFNVDYVRGLGDRCAVGIAPEKGNHYYEVKYLSCGGQVIPDSSITSSVS